MWLIADSGSTKTEWVLFDSEEQSVLVTSGLNPLFYSAEEFKATTRKSIPKDWIGRVTKIWFYGAGCGTSRIKESTKRQLQSVFIKASIHVESDLMAAARATCGTREGIAAILGTGSNSCIYNGESIVKQIKPLGFILGDEGSGVALGKSLLKKLLRDQLPSNLSEMIFQELKMDYSEIMNRVYKSELPNRFIASCTNLMYANRTEPAIDRIIKEEFNHFVRIIKEYKGELKANFVGSIAFYFQDNLKEILVDNEIKLGVILKTPSEALVKYHLERK